MEDKVSESIEIIAKEIISQQSNSQGRPMIELFKGDVVQQMANGIYIIRKIDFSVSPQMYEDAFPFIKSRNISS